MWDMVPFCKSGHIYYLTSVFVYGCIKAVDVTTCNRCINNINSQKRWNCKKFRTLPGTHKIKFLNIIVIASNHLIKGNIEGEKKQTNITLLNPLYAHSNKHTCNVDFYGP